MNTNKKRSLMTSRRLVQAAAVVLIIGFFILGLMEAGQPLEGDKRGLTFY